MKKKVILPLLVGLIALFALVGVYYIIGNNAESPADLDRVSDVSDATGQEEDIKQEGTAEDEGNSEEEDAHDSVDSDDDAPEEMTEDEKREAQEDAFVDAFDALTDKWAEDLDSNKNISMDDVRKFVEAFRSVPLSRRDECIHRALNLIPDDNVMVLAGILLDKSFDKETLETIFNDFLNRDESVKGLVLQQIFKDKTHPCWSDVAWILDVTGELPKSK